MGLSRGIERLILIQMWGPTPDCNQPCRLIWGVWSLLGSSQMYNRFFEDLEVKLSLLM